jgi:hypothetical protein
LAQFCGKTSTRNQHQADGMAGVHQESTKPDANNQPTPHHDDVRTNRLHEIHSDMGDDSTQMTQHHATPIAMLEKGTTQSPPTVAAVAKTPKENHVTHVWNYGRTGRWFWAEEYGRQEPKTILCSDPSNAHTVSAFA